MPRIDPLQLLKCLSVLLSPDGGILSRNEVPRLVSLMTKFSKKLVSKCVYVLILKNTETSLVDMFMAEGGWTLVQSWLQDAVPTGNWDLVKEILELLLVTPVDVERLKMNSLPKLIKSLSRREDLHEVATLSDQIVQNWLMIVKGSASTIAAPLATQVPSVSKVDTPEEKPNSIDTSAGDNTTEMKLESLEAIKEVAEEEILDTEQPIKTENFYKITVKDGKQVIKKLSADKEGSVKPEKDETDKKENEKSSKSSKSSSSSRSKSSSSSRDKDSRKSSSRSSSSKSSSSSSSSSSRDKSKDRRDKDRDRKDKDRKHSSSKSSSRSSSSSSTSSSRDKPKDKSKDSKEKQVEKDKDTLEILKPQTLDKLGRIPKKSSEEKQKESKEAEVKKPSFSILNRKATGEERGKTVKVFNSKMRSTGLEELPKPPPPRSGKKPTPSIQLPTIPTKRPSPPRESPSTVPPEKKIKIDKVDKPERPGAIKLIAPKPKRFVIMRTATSSKESDSSEGGTKLAEFSTVLQESDMFSDALTAAAPKKDAKKRKRRLSATKETQGSPTSSPTRADPQSSTSPTPASPTTLKNIAPINFYQDTLSEESEKTEDDVNETNNEENSPQIEDTPASPTADITVPSEDADMLPPLPKQMKLEGGLKGVLVYEKKKGPKRSIKWKEEEDLVEIRYFELDETERVNVTKTFMDMAKMDISSEREALIMSRKLANEDVMEATLPWRPPVLCEDAKFLTDPGSKSFEKDIQFAREKAVPAAEYYDKRMIPDSAKEPEPEVHPMSDPVSIPLEDPESQVIDLGSRPWPEPKGFDPQIEIQQQQQQQMPQMFPNIPFNPNFNNMGNMPPVVPFVGVPQRFPGPPGPHVPMGPVPGNFVPPNMMHNNMMGPPMNQPDMMNGGPMNPGMFVPGPEGFMGLPNEQQFPMQPFNGPPGPNMNMYGPNNFNHHRGGRGGGFRRGGGNNGGWVQLNGPRPWKRGGNNSGPHRGGRLCKNIQNHGYCRNGDNCPFVH